MAFIKALMKVDHIYSYVETEVNLIGIIKPLSIVTKINAFALSEKI